MTYLTWHFASDDYPESEFQHDEAVFEPSWWPATRGSDWCGEHEPKEPA